MGGRSIAGKFILAAVLAGGAVYAAYPYVTLYRIDQAVETGDAATLRSLVNWPAVRQGIKEDICDNVADQPAEAVSDQLPPFGASFVRGIATNAVDRRVTPQGLVAMTHRDAAVRDSATPAMHVTWAFFQDPMSFVVDLNARGQLAPIRVEMTLKDAVWQVTRIWLPADLLRQANAGT